MLHAAQRALRRAVGPLRSGIVPKRTLGSSATASSGSGLICWYSAQLAERPVLTKCLTSAFICASGDASTQLIIERRARLDLRRLSHFALLGGAVIGPTLHVWYGALARLVPGATWSCTARRVAADQLVFSPIFIAVVFGALAAMDGRLHGLQDQLQRDWSNTVVSNWAFWGPVQVINFGLVPLQFQVLFANVAAVVWNSYLSYIVHAPSSEAVTAAK